ncbi:MAG: tetratricopeptide repeat protein [Pseudomonadales bacterium]|nr:tetratricopeptide repeat protein [Pseudomonadales bacterium]
MEPMIRHIKRYSLTASLVLLSACGSLGATMPAVPAIPPPAIRNLAAAADPIDPARSDLPEPQADIQYANFPEDVLTRVILAEMAGQRGLNQQALEEYSALARETRDLNIVKRAARISAFLRNNPVSIEMAELWLELEPDAPEAHQTLALQLIALNRYREALSHFTRLLELERDVDFRLISGRTALDNDATLILDGLISDFEALVQRFPDNESAQLSLAHLYQQNKQYQLAYERVRDLAKKMNDAPEVVILEVQLLEMLGEEAHAVRRLQQSLRNNPQHKQLRFLYARKLVEEKKYQAAQTQFALIVEQNPDDYDMLYSLALISMEIQLYSDARVYLQTLVDNGQRLDDAHFYLAFLSEQDNQAEQAIEHYLQIKSGSNFLQAQRNLTELMIKAGRYPEARERLLSIRYTNPDYNIPLLTMEASVLMDEGYTQESAKILDSAIAAFPNNVQLLFLRSVLNQELNHLDLMEHDLRKVIQLNPESPVAYNSLGYTLADRTTRYQEAYELIRRAIELAPNDPAIIDSLGWVQYRLGMLDEAQVNLERAFELFPDHEVAAHLGEVLWVKGEHSEANKIWRNALKLQPDSAPIKNAIQRLSPEN